MNSRFFKVRLINLLRSLSAWASRPAAPFYKFFLGRLLSIGLNINKFGFPCGYSPVPTPARFYIDLFLEEFCELIQGRVVEFNPPYYRQKYQTRSSVTQYDVWDIQEGEGVSIIADLQNAHDIADDSFDTIICTHVLCNVPRPWLAVKELYRLLAPGGTILLTVPMLLQGYAPHPKDYWRITPDGLGLLFEDFRDVQIRSYGNAATASGSPQFLMTWHFPRRVLNHHDSHCPSVIALAARK